MSTRRPLRVTITRAIVRARLEAVESVVAFVAAITGFWLMFPYWEFNSMFNDVTSVQEAQMAIAVALMLMGTIHILAMVIGAGRRTTSMGLFMAMIFLTWLAMMAAGATSIIWVPFLGLTVLSGLAHLSYSLGDS